MFPAWLHLVVTFIYLERVREKELVLLQSQYCFFNLCNFLQPNHFFLTFEMYHAAYTKYRLCVLLIPVIFILWSLHAVILGVSFTIMQVNEFVMLTCIMVSFTIMHLVNITPNSAGT